MLSAKIATPGHASNDGHSDAEWMELLSIMDEYTDNPPPISAEYLLQVLAWWAVEDATLIAEYHRLMQSRNLKCIAPCRACVERGDQILGFPLNSRNLPSKAHPSSPPSSHRAVQGIIRSISPEKGDLSQSTLAYSDKPPSSFAPRPSPRIVQGGMAPSMNTSSCRVQVAGTASARAPHEQRRVAITHGIARAGSSTARPWPATQGPSNRQHALQPRGVTGNPYPEFPPLFSTYTTAVEPASAGGRGLGDAGHQWQGFRTS